jgi:hypothetical protein
MKYLKKHWIIPNIMGICLLMYCYYYEINKHCLGLLIFSIIFFAIIIILNFTFYHVEIHKRKRRGYLKTGKYIIDNFYGTLFLWSMIFSGLYISNIYQKILIALVFVYSFSFLKIKKMPDKMEEKHNK